MALHGALTHRKTRNLASFLGIQVCYAMGILEALWHTTAEQCPQGNIGRLSNVDIAMEMFYTEDADALIAALLKAKFLDENKEFRLVVHNWAKRVDYNTKRKLLRYSLLIVDDGELKEVYTRRGVAMKIVDPKTHKDGAEQAEEDHITKPTISPAMVAQGVMHELRISGMKTSVALEGVCRSELAGGADATELRDSMVAAWQEYSGIPAASMEYKWGTEKFFGDGNWKNKAAWPWKDGSNGADRRNGNDSPGRTSAAKQRQHESDDAFRRIAQRRYGVGVAAADETNTGPVRESGVDGGDGGDVSRAVGRNGRKIRHPDIQGSVI